MALVSCTKLVESMADTLQDSKDYTDAQLTANAVPDASATVKGKVELATPAEVIAGSSSTLAVTPAGVKAALDDAIGALADSDNQTLSLSGNNLTISGGNTVDLSGLTPAAATATTAGIVELATTAEASTGTDTTRAVTPAGVAAAITANAGAAVPVATGSTQGKVSLATAADMPSTSDTEATTPSYVAAFVADAVLNGATPAASETVAGKAEIATQTETNAGTDDTRMVSPKKLKTFVDAAIASIPADRFIDSIGSYDPATNTFVITLSDGSTINADMTDLVNDAVSSIGAASATAAGIVELATTAEAAAGTDTTRAVTAAGVSANVAAALADLGTLTQFSNNAGNNLFKAYV